MGPADTGDDLEFVSYREFGEQFFAQVVTEDRVLAAVNMLSGQPIDFGPKGVGPGRLVKLTATGAIGAARSEPVPDGDVVTYRMTLPVDLAFAIDLGLETHRFNATLAVPLVLAARAVSGLRVYIEVRPPRPHEVDIQLRAEGLRASVLQRVAGVEGEVKRFVARYVEREVTKPYVRKARLIDLRAQVDRAWERIAPHAPSPTAEHIRGDLREAIEEEIDASTAEPLAADPDAADPVAPRDPAGERIVERSTATLKRLGLEGIGWTLVVGGIAALFLPGPGLLMLLGGLAILSQQYEWAERRVRPVEIAAMRAASDGVNSTWRLMVSLLGVGWLWGTGLLWIVRPPAPALVAGGRLVVAARGPGQRHHLGALRVRRLGAHHLQLPALQGLALRAGGARARDRLSNATLGGAATRRVLHHIPDRTVEH